MSNLAAYATALRGREKSVWTMRWLLWSLLTAGASWMKVKGEDLDYCASLQNILLVLNLQRYEIPTQDTEYCSI